MCYLHRFFLLNAHTSMLVSLELQGLEALEFQMTRNLEALRERREAAKFASTFKGMAFNTMGRLFMAYCMIRLITVSVLSIIQS